MQLLYSSGDTYCRYGEIFTVVLPRLSKPERHWKASSFQGFFFKIGLRKRDKAGCRREVDKASLQRRGEALEKGRQCRLAARFKLPLVLCQERGLKQPSSTFWTVYLVLLSSEMR